MLAEQEINCQADDCKQITTKICKDFVIKILYAVTLYIL